VVANLRVARNMNYGHRHFWKAPTSYEKPIVVMRMDEIESSVIYKEKTVRKKIRTISFFF
jgi:hypothetical protein